MSWLDRVLDCVVSVAPFAFDEVALERALARGLVAEGLAEALQALSEVALVIGRKSPDAAGVLYRAIERRASAVAALGIDGIEAGTSAPKRAPMFGARAPTGTLKAGALAASLRR